jgi:ribosomal-protein-alanine N-acetyltransferase
VEDEVERVSAFRRLSPLLASAGQPSPSEIEVIAQAGFKHLINLALPTSPGALADEASLAERAGLEYLHLPIDFELPDLRQASQLFSALDERQNEPVFVHCAKNMRVSALLYVYRCILAGVPARQARADLHAIWQPNHIWRRYMSNAALRALPRPVRLETERLVLRDAEPGDAEAIQRYAGDPEVVRLMVWGPNTLEQTREFLQHRVGYQQVDPERREFELLIVEKATDRVVGGAGLRVHDSAALSGDLGYVLTRAYWGQGIVPEACHKLLELGFGGFGLHRIWASADARNLQSRRVMEKLGMRREAHLRDEQWIKDQYRDTVVYALTEDEYWSREAQVNPAAAMVSEA